MPAYRSFLSSVLTLTSLPLDIRQMSDIVHPWDDLKASLPVCCSDHLNSNVNYSLGNIFSTSKSLDSLEEEIKKIMALI